MIIAKLNGATNNGLIMEDIIMERVLKVISIFSKD